MTSSAANPFSLLSVASIVAEAEEPSVRPRGGRKGSAPHRAAARVTLYQERIRQGIFVLNPLKKPEYSFRTAYMAMRGGLRTSDLSQPDSESSNEPQQRRLPVIRLSPIVKVKAPRTPSRSPSPIVFVGKKRDRPSHATNPSSSEEEQLALKDCFPGNNGVHLAKGTPTTLEHRLALFERIMAKRRSGQSIGGVRPGNPLQVTELPAAELLMDSEFELCCGLRLTPAQYFHSRRTLIDNYWQRGWYNKSAAQKMLRIDVNKTGKLWEFLVKCEWMPEKPGGQVKPPPHDLNVGRKQQ